MEFENTPKTIVIVAGIIITLFATFFGIYLILPGT